jgi:hypothetical protein
MAVGYAIDDAGVERTLAEAWDGSRWTARPTPNPAGAVLSALLGVSCPQEDACIAVGMYVNGSGQILALAESWEGTSWTIQNAPIPLGAAGAELAGVSCRSPNACTAVGAYGDGSGATLTLAEAWDGSDWSVEATPNPSGAQGSVLVGVSCVSTDACVAAGSYGDSSGTSLTLAESRDGSTWSIESTPNPTGSGGSELDDVSCATATACTAVGRAVSNSGTVQGLAERRNGPHWSLQTVQSPAGATRAGLFGVSCPSVTACTAVGEYAGSSGPGSTLAESWDGSTWTIRATPNPARGPDSGLSGVSCPSTSACAGVGSHQSRVGQTYTLGERWDGTAWTINRTPDVRGATPSFLDSVSCPSTGDCVAVGSGDVSGDVFRGHGRTLAEAWDGSRWTRMRTAERSRVSYSIFTSVSCTSVRFCMAVGWYDIHGHHVDHALAERWNGSRWTVEPVPDPAAGSGRTALRAVSCTSRMACTAVGQYDHRRGSRTLAERWNGSTWRPQRTPNPSGSQFNDLGGVSCVSARRCWAVGSYVGSKDFGLTLVLVRRHGKWTIQKSPNPKGATGSVLSAVSCVSRLACVAVGTSADAALAERWNGTRWTVQRTPSAPPNLPSAYLAGVSCATARACTAAGYVLMDFGTSEAWVLRWNGTRWRVEPTPSPAGAVRTSLEDVSCATASTCTAVGDYFTTVFDQVTLAEARSG